MLYSNAGLLFQSSYFLTMFPAKAVIIKQWKSKTQGYQRKLKVRLVSRFAEQFKA